MDEQAPYTTLQLLSPTTYRPPSLVNERQRAGSVGHVLPEVWVMCCLCGNDILLTMFTFIFLLLASNVLSWSDVETLWMPGFESEIKRPYNPSLVEYQGTYYAALRHSRTPKAKNKLWYIDRVYVCKMRSLESATKCIPYYPYKDPYNECEFPPSVRPGVDMHGLGDIKLFTWHGKGVFAMFGRKPQRHPGQRYCVEKVIYDPWLASIAMDNESAYWSLSKPVRLILTTGFTYPSIPEHVEEKNWMPWVYHKEDGTDVLYMSHMINPHRVLEVFPNGTCIVAYETIGSPDKFSFLSSVDLHGGPPAVLIPENLSKRGESYYAGVLHYYTLANATRGGKLVTGVKIYRHFGFMFESQPPFRVIGISDEIKFASFDVPLPTTMRTMAFVSGFALARDNTILISYGAGDLQSRVLSMSVAEFEDLFSGQIKHLHRMRGDDSEYISL